MPKSKRNRPVTLSKTKKKGREQKEKIVDSIRKAVEDFNSIYVFSFENMRNLKFKEFREQLKCSSRFFLGSNKVMQISLGRSVSDEIRPRLHKVSKLLHGNAGLFFTNLPKEEIMRLFAEFEEHDFARTDTTPTSSPNTFVDRKRLTAQCINLVLSLVDIKKGSKNMSVWVENGRASEVCPPFPFMPLDVPFILVATKHYLLI
ncbi:hypothetical protein MKX01_027312 [Papaver californicum]|nr:hypothetical protein MKX01_027312 [Papaver californicum]